MVWTGQTRFVFLNFLIVFRKTEWNGEGGEKENRFVVPPIHAFVGWFLYVTWPGIKPTTLAYWDDTNQLSYPARAQICIFKKRVGLVGRKWITEGKSGCWDSVQVTGWGSGLRPCRRRQADEDETCLGGRANRAQGLMEVWVWGAAQRPQLKRGRTWPWPHLPVSRFHACSFYLWHSAALFI